jgi:hypothetical protein
MVRMGWHMRAQMASQAWHKVAEAACADGKGKGVGPADTDSIRCSTESTIWDALLPGRPPAVVHTRADELKNFVSM